MRKPFLSILFFLFISLTFGQSPSVQWGKYMGIDSSYEYLNDGKASPNKDAYFFTGAITPNINIDPGIPSTPPSQGYNIWTKRGNYTQGLLLKTDLNGNAISQHYIEDLSSGNALGFFFRIDPFTYQPLELTAIAGNRMILFPDRPTYPGTPIFWMSLVDKNGEKPWYFNYDDYANNNLNGFAYDIKNTSYQDAYSQTHLAWVLAGVAYPIMSGLDTSVHKGMEGGVSLFEYWGPPNSNYRALYGGSGDDTLWAVQNVNQTYYLSGTSRSKNGDLPNNYGGSDGWLLSTSHGYLKLTRGISKNYGGSKDDGFKTSVYDPIDGTIVSAGYSYSNDGDLNGNHGQSDFWVMKSDLSGNRIWSRLYGGSDKDFASRIVMTEDSGYLVTGTTSSKDGDVVRSAGKWDIWTIKLDRNGNLIWQTCNGTVGNEFGTGLIPLQNTEFILSGIADPAINFHKDSSDALLIKITRKNLLIGSIFLDLNKNGQKDPGESSFEKAALIAENPGDTSKNVAMSNNGIYKMFLDTGNYRITTVPFYPYYTVSPELIDISHSSFDKSDSVNFAIQPKPGIKDLGISLLPLTPARPGFAIQYKMIVSNDGTEIIPAATVSLLKDSRLIFQNASPMTSITNDDTLKWTINNFAPADTAVFTINFKAAIPPALNNGDTLKSTASLPLENDTLPSNNTFNLKQRVTGSYDPNDKRESHGGIITEEQLANDGWLNYLVRFQNTGTDTAFTVTVKDTLSNKVDWSSLELIDASHSYKMEMENGRITWLFEEIMLVDSNQNEPKSHGFIAYRIKPNPTVKAGDTIPNRAAIYFDYNLPVVTNTDLVKINQNTGTFCQGGTASFSVSQANVSTYTWEANGGNGFSPINDNSLYSGTHTAILHITSPPSSMTGTIYRCRMLLNNGNTIYSDPQGLKFLNTWTGLTSTNWHEASNWECGVIPDANTDVLIIKTANQPEINENASCKSIQANGNSSVRVKQGVNFTVSGNRK